MIDDGEEIVIDEIEQKRGLVKIGCHKKYTKEKYYVHLRSDNAVKWAGYLLAMAGSIGFQEDV